ncbi:Neopullulanase (plasmid) [Pediococcus damnosus]|uniref:Neopullulanase n=1 Tax=Pediococcus damnosus TaxID=51663 RepID=A0A143AVV3_9LACO|nr:glycoside hydrolase family 13 protein [Pediococcus damnosus]AMV63736.1 Neopullulanase [Pediococcus damnosus]AMV68266.1 Neopullulanase [Pediococcus damnosus]AMV68326.1 Neopullulanase [Pediococcus damnosus]
MNFAAIYHRPESEMAFLDDPQTMHIRLRTAKGDIKTVQLLHGDPYSLRSLASIKPPFYITPTPMKKILSDDLYDYWQIAVTEPKKRLAYAFDITSVDGIRTVYTDHGYIQPDDHGALEDLNTYFRMPFFQEIDMFHSSEWVKNTVWYQIFPERFANGDRSNDPIGTKKWNASDHPGRQDFYGGDLQGVLDHLNHLQKLGVNGIYFNPLFKAPSNHKYDTEDYYQIDPHFGNAALFKEVVTQAHQRGIHVMLDAVFNHIGDKSLQWQDVLKNGQRSKYAGWFHVNKFPATYTPTKNFEFTPDATYDTFDYTPHMPKLNTANPAVQEYLLGIAKYWIKEFDIDAWRLDVANEIDHHFWKRFHKETTALKPDFYILGEIWHTSQAWLNGDEFSGVMNYSYTGAILDHFINHRISAEQMIDHLSNQLMKYRDQTNQMMFNVLDSHDTARIMTQARGNRDLVKETFAFTFLQPGTPSIYYGTEYGMDGDNDPDCRKPMNWVPDDDGQDMFTFFKKLVALRRNNADLIEGGMVVLKVLPTGLVEISRMGAGKVLTGIFNTTNLPIKCLSTGRLLLSQGVQDHQLMPNGFVITMK